MPQRGGKRNKQAHAQGDGGCRRGCSSGAAARPSSIRRGLAITTLRAFFWMRITEVEWARRLCHSGRRGRACRMLGPTSLSSSQLQKRWSGMNACRKKRVRERREMLGAITDLRRRKTASGAPANDAADMVWSIDSGSPGNPLSVAGTNDQKERTSQAAQQHEDNDDSFAARRKECRKGEIMAVAHAVPHGAERARNLKEQGHGPAGQSALQQRFRHHGTQDKKSQAHIDGVAKKGSVLLGAKDFAQRTQECATATVGGWHKKRTHCRCVVVGRICPEFEDALSVLLRLDWVLVAELWLGKGMPLPGDRLWGGGRHELTH